MLGEAMSIFARNTRVPSGNSPLRMRSNRSRLSSSRPLAPGAVLTRLGEGAAVLANLVGREVVDVGLAGPDQVNRPFVELIEVVGREVEMLAPVEAQPADVFLDRVDVLLLLLDRVRVVEAQVAAPAELARDAEVERDRLRVPDVQVAVRLGREAGYHARMPALPQVGGHDLADEIASLRRGRILSAHLAAALDSVWLGARRTRTDMRVS